MTTNYRPTPLQHYMFPVGGDGLQMVVDEAGSFREDSFQRVCTSTCYTPSVCRAQLHHHELRCLSIHRSWKQLEVEAADLCSAKLSILLNLTHHFYLHR